MCFCTPSIRTPFCPSCNQAMFLRIGDLHKQLAAAQGRVKELEAIVEKQIDDGCDKIMAMTDEQISALCRLEGHDPDDEAKLAKQAAEIAILKHKLSSADQDRADAERLRELADERNMVSDLVMDGELLPILLSCHDAHSFWSLVRDAVRATQKERDGGV